MAKQKKKDKPKIIRLKVWTSDFGIPKFVEKEFKYCTWDELLKEEEDGNTKQRLFSRLQRQ